MSEIPTMAPPTVPSVENTKRLTDLLAEPGLSIHLVGIGGCGMSGLAKLLLARGHRVAGSDLEENAEVQRLRRQGVVVHLGHSREHLRTPDLVVFTSAASEQNPELVAALEARIPCLRRAQILAALMQGHERAFAVAGTHGKTTTTALLAHILRRADLAPSFCVGAHVPILGENAAVGSGKIFVAEADESDGTLSDYTPTDALILNIEPEHLDHFGNLDALLESFRVLAGNATRHVFYCADDLHATLVCADLPHAISFGLGETALFRDTKIRQEGFSTSFELVERGQSLGRITLRIPGMQNVSNATAAAAAARAAGTSFEQIAAAVAEFTGAVRRFERKLHNDDYLVIDDYAHHPTEIRATLEAVRGLGCRRIVALFQPHRFTRTKLLRSEFGRAFALADQLFLTDVYPASEEPMEGISGLTIFKAVKEAGQKEVRYEPKLERLANAVMAEVQRGDAIVVLGAGDITKVSDELAMRLRRNPLPRFDASRDDEEKFFGDLCEILSNRSVIIRNEPLAKHTSLKVGGLAQFWVEPDDERDLSKLVRYCRQNRIPFYFIGRGTNLLIKDGGVAGVVIRLNHLSFCQVEIEGDHIHAGAGVSLRNLVLAAKRMELTGLEFMEGIPGSLGGALRMNAGAMGSNTFDMIESVRIMNFEGQIFDRSSSELQPAYRCCEALKNHVALKATLRVQKGSRPEIERRLFEFEHQRWASQPAAPSAGCIFKNPEAIPAGKLVDELGLKGTAVGGARISEIHGNFIINEGGATASDVLKLIGQIQGKARQARNIELETEVEIWGNP